MSRDPLSEFQLRHLFRHAERVAHGLPPVSDEFVVVLEFAPHPGDGSFEVSEVASLVEALEGYDPSALFNPQRYAIQLHVDATTALSALTLALAVHDEAVHKTFGRSDFVRAEILTLNELEDDWEREQLAVPPPSRPGSPPIICADVYLATRSLIGATTSAEITSILISFVEVIGGTIHVGTSYCPLGAICVELCVERGAAVTASAEANSVAGLIIEQSLPGLIQDAEVARARLEQPHVAESTCTQMLLSSGGMSGSTGEPPPSSPSDSSSWQPRV